jgi:hypothetical protein
MDFIEIANTEARERAEADPNVAVILVGPDDRFALSDMMREEGRLEIVHRENFGIDEREAVYVKCEDEWVVEGFEKAWSSYLWFRRRLPAENSRTFPPAEARALPRRNGTRSS